MKMSDKKLEANRQNARRGGPKTKELVLSQDEVAEFEASRRGLQEALQPNGALLSLLFDEVVACAWQVKQARRRVQAEMHKMAEDATDDGKQGRAAEGSSLASMIIAGHPYTLTPSQLRKQMEFLDAFWGAGGFPSRLGEWKQPVTAAFGADFWQYFEEWEPTDAELLYHLKYSELSRKSRVFEWHPTVVEKKDRAELVKEAKEIKEIDIVAKAVSSHARFQLLGKLIELKKQALLEALQYVVGMETGEATASGKNRLELFLRYQTTAKRDFYRALKEYEKRKKLTTKV